jgi:hypothetical protein
MEKLASVSRVYNFTCDQCGFTVKEESLPKDWIRVTEVEKDGIRLYERPAKVARYESFHVPGRETRDYCCADCALEKYKKSMELFLRELKPIKINQKSVPLT